MCFVAVERARVLYAYKAENADELSIEEGQIINILDKVRLLQLVCDVTTTVMSSYCVFVAGAAGQWLVEGRVEGSGWCFPRQLRRTSA